MVKVARMKRAKRILLIAGVLAVTVGTADAKIWGSRKADKPAENASLATPVALSAIDVEGSRVLLRTNGAPAYTSYSPSPGVFVVDLTGTSKEAGATIPQALPPAVTSIAAEEVVEMGSPLTRVTFRLSEPFNPEVAAVDNAVVITIPASAIPIETAAASVDVLPAVTPSSQMAMTAPVAAAEPVPEPAPTVEAINDPVVEVAEPVARVEEIALPRARTVKRIDAVTTDGNVEVRISADGQLKYKAFRLENPSRLVIDLDGVKNAAAKTAVAVNDEVVQRVRVAQFQPTVARVVVDLTRKSEYDIVAVGDELRIAFGATARASNEPAPAPVMTPAVKAAAVPAAQQWKPAPAPEPVRQAAAPAPAADLPSQVPTVATDAPAWSVPEPARVDPPRTQVARAEPVRREPVSKGAHSVIRQSAAPAPAQRPPTQEDVFGEAAASQPTNAAQNLSAAGGGRTLSGGPRVFNGEPLSLNLKDADIKDVLRTFAELTGLNIAVDPGVSGAVTVDFVDVPWDQALDLILRQNGLTFTIEGNVMRIGTVERIAAEATATRRLEEEERLKVQLTTLSFKLSYARATDVAVLLKDIASPRARIIVDARTNQLIVSEIPDFLRTMQNLITTVDIPSKQVMIEARIVESLRTFSQTWGFELGFGGDLDPALGTGTGLVFPNRIGYDAGPFNFAGPGDPVISLHLFDVLGTFNLDFALHAAEDQGFAKIVSAPRVTTQDNQAAEIQSGFSIPYQTRVNFTTTVTYLDATLRLAVTPQITEAGTVIMDISVQKNEPATGVSIPGAAGTSLTTRQARTRLMVRDGGTAVIAGIFQTRDNSSQHRLPFVHNIPVIGALFRTHSIETSHDELLIFITPRIVRG